MQFSTLAVAALIGVASAQKVHVVSVSGGNNTLVFSPDNLKAEVNDMIQFQFRAGNHSVVQSAFDSPCVPISMTSNNTGIFSGYQPVAASQATGMIPTYTIKVTAANPMWMYCSQGKHCQAGMVMVINENPTANATRTLTNYKAAAKLAAQNLAPGGGASNGGGSGTGTGTGTGGGNGGTGTGTGTGSASNPAATAGASILEASRSVGLIALAAAWFML